MARAGFTIEPPGRRQGLVAGNRAAVDPDNTRAYKFRTREEADRYVESANVPAVVTAITATKVFTPNNVPTSKYGRKSRDWDALSERQKSRLQSNWAIRGAAERSGLTVRQYTEHGGDIRPIENRGFREKGFQVYISRESDEMARRARA